MNAPSFASRKAHYRELWDSLVVEKRKAIAVLSSARKIAANRGRYTAVADATGVPWWIIGLIHQMEASLDFSTHLHNGDPLTARTVQVPKGRPKEGAAPFTWEVSAIDAIRYDGLHKVTDWTIERVCYELEKYNGWGYANHHPTVPTPYLWSFSNHYMRGKYVKDGEWLATEVSGQSGAMVLLRALIERGDVSLDRPMRAPFVETPPLPNGIDSSPAPHAPSAPAPSLVAVAAKSKTVWSLLNAKLLIVLGFLTDIGRNGFDWIAGLVGAVPNALNEATGLAEQGGKLSELVGFDWKRIAISATVACLAVALIRHIRDKRELEVLRRQPETVEGQHP